MIFSDNHRYLNHMTQNSMFGNSVGFTYLIFMSMVVEKTSLYIKATAPIQKPTRVTTTGVNAELYEHIP